MIVITHNGTDITDQVNPDSFTISDARNNERDTLLFSVDRAPGGFAPELNAEIIVTKDGERIFGGTLVSQETSIAAPPTVTYTVECVDYSYDMDRLLVTERFIDKTTTEIITTLRDDYATGYTLNNLQSSFTVERISFNRLTMSECLNKLAKLNNYNWYVDYNKDIHFFARNAEPAPFNLTDDSNNYIFDSLRIRSDLSQLRNRVLVEGGEAPVDPRTAKAAGDGERTEFSTIYKFDTKPTVTVDGAAQTVGVEYLDESGFDCYWSRAEKYIRFDTPPPAPTTGQTNIDMTGDPLVPVLAEVPDDDSINEYGVFEHAVLEKTLQSQDQTIDRAIAELEAYADSLKEASFQTYTPGLRSGQLITIDSTLHGVDAEYVVQGVQFKPYPNGSSLDGTWDVTLASTATMSIVDAMRQLLAGEQLEDDEQQTLLAFYSFTDGVTGSESIAPIETRQAPYVWNTAEWNFATWG